MTETQTPWLIRDLMTIGVPTCTPATPLSEITRLILDHDYETLVVLDTDGHAIGIVSQDEVMRAYSRAFDSERDEVRSLTAEQIMRDEIPTTLPDIPLITAAQIMQDQGVRVLYLMHHAGGIEYPAAMISYRHILRFLAAEDYNSLKDLGLYAERRSPLDVFIQKRDAARKKRL